MNAIPGYHLEFTPLTFNRTRLIYTDGHTSVEESW